MANNLSFEKQTRIISALAEDCSIRGIERMTGVHRDTIMRLGVRIGQGCCRILDRVMFTMRAFGKDDPQKEESAFLTIAADFLLVYSITDVSDLDDASFRSFAELNGTYNAWPYWREFVQNITSRMDLPTLTIPVFRLPCGPSKAPDPQEAQTEAATKE
jgi:hypothetical protein